MVVLIIYRASNKSVPESMNYVALTALVSRGDIGRMHLPLKIADNDFKSIKQ